MLDFRPRVSGLTYRKCIVRCLAIVGLTSHLFFIEDTSAAATQAATEIYALTLLNSSSGLMLTGVDDGFSSTPHSEIGWQRKETFMESSSQETPALRRPTILTRTIIDLEWTAPGDDGDVGSAWAYEIRYSPFPLSESSWDQAIRFNWPPYPLVSGSYQIAVIHGLQIGTPYYFGIKSRDEVGNWSGLSNIVRDTVRIEEAICGDVTADAMVSLADVVGLINYIFGGGRPPSPLLVGDANCSGSVSVSDAIYLLSYLFGGGDPPCCLH